jgi:hypothetical protein
MTKRKQFSLRNYVRLRGEMLESPARAALTLSARKILDRLEIELLRHGGKDNGALIVTYEDFKRHGIHHNAIGPALRELEALGFIEIVRRGFAGNADQRQPHMFRLTYLPTDSSKGPTDEWKRFKDLKEAEVIAAKARSDIPKGYPRRHRVTDNSQYRKPVLATCIFQYRKTRKPIPETGIENDPVSIPETGTEDREIPIPKTGTTI